MKIGIIVAMSKELAALQRAGMTDAVQSGIGKAGAARTATELILRERPDCIINSGCAGGLAPSVAVGDTVLGAQTAYHDVWCGEGNLPGQVQGLPQRFDADPALLRKALSLPAAQQRVHSGLICTGDWFVTSLQEDEKVLGTYPEALACDMESAAIAQVCHHYGVPFLSFRIISDTRVGGHDMQAYADFWDRISDSSFLFLKQLIDIL